MKKKEKTILIEKMKKNCTSIQGNFKHIHMKKRVQKLNN